MDPFTEVLNTDEDTTDNTSTLRVSQVLAGGSGAVTAAHRLVRAGAAVVDRLNLVVLAYLASSKRSDSRAAVRGLTITSAMAPLAVETAG